MTSPANTRTIANAEGEGEDRSFGDENDDQREDLDVDKMT